ncbi:MAG TPA: sialate O-acetylesterase [Gemmataceae bacterium]|jgi:alpha-galactosidase|nr:sialate O-acetylesterase [Gemmataceae bacterium]
MASRVTVLVLFGMVAPLGAADPQPVRVFVLAGQSNMEGKAKVVLFDRQVKDAANKDVFAPYRAGDKWAERDDVFVKFLDRKGKLTVGFGSPGCVGPELGFGNVVGDYFDEPVLLIKTAWGGRSLYRDFRPPSAGLPPQAVLDKMLADLRKRTPTATADDVKKPFGASYRAMLAEVASTLSDLKTHFPALAGRPTELTGLVWFQGWNDMISADATAEYAVNLVHFIRDVRKDLKAPDLPVVVGEMGVDGANPGANIKRFKEAQAKGVAAFKSNVALVKTDVFWDTTAEAVFKKGWREHLDEWNGVGSDYPYHYLGSAKTMLAMGRAMGDAAVALHKAKGGK